MLQDTWDCIVIGAGPGGLTAALYLARFRRSCLVFDNGRSRAKLILRSHNYPGAKYGIPGPRLLANLEAQLKPYKVPIKQTTVIKIKRLAGHLFKVYTQKNTYIAKNIIMATGAIDIEPNLPRLKNSIQKGLVRHCAICDAFEIINKEVAVLGTGTKVINQAIFLRHYTPRITIFNCSRKFNACEKQFLKNLNIQLVEEPIVKVHTVKCKLTALLTGDNIYHFDTVYSALGSVVRSHLVIPLGVFHNSDGFIKVNQHQETNIKGIYAIGDVVAGLSQICVATAHAAIASVSINKNLNHPIKVHLKSTK